MTRHGPDRRDPGNVVVQEARWCKSGESSCGRRWIGHTDLIMTLIESPSSFAHVDVHVVFGNVPYSFFWRYGHTFYTCTYDTSIR